MRRWSEAGEELRRSIVAARERLRLVDLPEELLVRIARVNAALEIPGHRGELTMARAGRAAAALDGRVRVELSDLREVGPLALRHRTRKDPLDPLDATHRLDDVLEEHLRA